MITKHADTNAAPTAKDAGDADLSPPPAAVLPPLPALPPLPPVPPKTEVAFEEFADADGAAEGAPEVPVEFVGVTEVPAEAEPVRLIKIVPDTKLRRFWRRFGGDGFVISVVVHLALFIVAYVLIKTVIVASTEPVVKFDSGAGGGNEGERVSLHEHRIKPRHSKDVVKNVSRLTTKNASSIALPELPKTIGGLQTGGLIGGASKGFGGGAGGGIGGGIGPGRGGRHMAGMFKVVMGVKMDARKVAVYLDNSGSMRPFLENVKKEIYEQYPDADIFEHDGIRTLVSNNRIEMGRDVRLPAVRTRPRGRTRSTFATATTGEEPKLSVHGKAVLERYGRNFDNGSVGAWADVMMYDAYYGALVVFSDFQDGVIIDGNRHDDIPEVDKGAKRVGAPWHERWIKQFAKAADPKDKKAPRLYLFSIQMPPQEVWRECVKASGGEIKMMRELRRERRAAGTSKAGSSTRAAPATKGKKAAGVPMQPTDPVPPEGDDDIEEL